MTSFAGIAKDAVADVADANTDAGAMVSSDSSEEAVVMDKQRCKDRWRGKRGKTRTGEQSSFPRVLQGDGGETQHRRSRRQLPP